MTFFNKIPRSLHIALLSLVLLAAIIGVALLQKCPSCCLAQKAFKKAPASSNTTAAISTDDVSVALGHYLARNLNTPGLSYDLEKVIAGMRNEAAGLSSPLSEESFAAAISDMQNKYTQKLSQTNLTAAQEYLEKISHESDVVSLNPQLFYRVLKPAPAEEGALGVESSSSPLIHFSCKLLDGTVISSSYENEPISLPLEHAIQGIREGMIGMKAGEKRCLYIHPELGFAAAGQLPPNSLLIFEVEVIALQTKAQANDLETKEEAIEECPESDIVSAPIALDPEA